ncbi:MAG: V-type ATP synthase subunit A [Erysipelotrichaceae bacterium]|jgi:V/A-type H+-transporting ATPase subunit A|nr:V-type ATP synthase subunit A [Erysipelotrichaceae bacterium]
MSFTIHAINGPVVKVQGVSGFFMQEMVLVSKRRLMGEVIGITESDTLIQVYESTEGIQVGEPVEPTGQLLSCVLGPGILTNIYDGIQRSLKDLASEQGAFISIASKPESLNAEKKWPVTFNVKQGDEVRGGQVFASTPETSLITHKIMVPPDVSGKVIFVAKDGDYNIHEILLKVEAKDGSVRELTMTNRWPIRQPRPVKKQLGVSMPLVTGQRVIDTLFPIAKGGAAAVPGGFGAGKTMTQHQIAKWCDADIIVYVGCGERGNEMTEVLSEFSDLIDPKSGKPLLERTVLIANTSNMPVAAREASIYTGITLAEYYRDMGYHVALMADSTSRWAEALREISGRLEEMPAEEGFPAYLPSRIAQFYERAGMVETLGEATGSVSLIGAVSPQGADFSEPVTQNTKRFVRCFWALDKALAYARHYPAINWNDSYSEYLEDLEPWYKSNIGRDFSSLRALMTKLLHEENELNEIVKLIGADVLPDDQKLTLAIAKCVRVGFLQQNAFHAEDTYVPLEKQYKMMKVIAYLYEATRKLVEHHIPVRLIAECGVFELVEKIKYDVANSELALLDEYPKKIDQALAKVE